MPWITKSSTEVYTQQPPESYTQSQKAGNWLHYHWKLLAILAILVIVIALMMRDRAQEKAVDQQVGYVGCTMLRDEDIDELERLLSQYAPDTNGDGKVSVTLVPYYIDFTWGESSDLDRTLIQTAYTQLSADIGSGQGSYLFLMDDPQRFFSTTAALSRTDGSRAEQNEAWQNCVFACKDCPAMEPLLPLLPENVYIGRLAVAPEQSSAFDGGPEFWQALTAGAQPLAAGGSAPAP